MSDIILLQEKTTIELKRVEVPDYTESFNAVDKLKELKLNSQQAANKTVSILSDSILDQIAAYLHELLKPVLIYYDKHKQDIPHLIKWCCCGWVLDTYREVGMPYENYMKLRFCGDLEILFSPEEYEVHMYESDPKKQGNILKDLASRWSDFKKYTQDTIKRTLKALESEETTEIRRNQGIIDALNNFEL